MRTITGLFIALAFIAARAAAGAETPAVAGAAAAYPGTLKLSVDASDVDRRIVRVHEEIPVTAGPLTLLYPQWLPGNHSPRGRVDMLAGLVFTANGKRVDWTRGSTDVFAFHLDVPSGATTLVAEFDTLAPQDATQGQVLTTQDMIDLQWGSVVLYPAGYPVGRITIAADAKLPDGWSFATALDPAGGTSTPAFRAVSLETLVDSPLLAGRHFRREDLDPGAKVPVHLDIVAEDPKYLDITPEQLKAHRELVRQAYKLFGSHHYDHYDFLLMLSDHLAHIGLEHHRSSEDGVAPGYFTAWESSAPGRDLLAHEYTHSWNGKFRRPAGLATPDYNTPTGDSLLWVYEGQTQFWGYVLAARSGLWNAEQTHDALALVVSRYSDNRPGFSWRNIEDTTNDPVAALRRPLPYRNYQMSEEYYSAGLLLWLDVDAKLRSLTRDRRSLDDFARRFFGIDDGAWNVEPYKLADVVDALNAVAPYDWRGFLEERIEANAPPLDAVAASGWRLVYNDKPSAYQRQSEAERNMIDHAASIGLTISTRDSRIDDVRWDSAAFKAGIASGGTLVAVDGREFTAERLRDAIERAKKDARPIELLIKKAEWYRTYRVDYRGGLKYPHLERLRGTPDRLDALLEPRH